MRVRGWTVRLIWLYSFFSVSFDNIFQFVLIDFLLFVIFFAFFQTCSTHLTLNHLTLSNLSSFLTLQTLCFTFPHSIFDPLPPIASFDAFKCLDSVEIFESSDSFAFFSATSARNVKTFDNMAVAHQFHRLMIVFSPSRRFYSWGSTKTGRKKISKTLINRSFAHGADHFSVGPLSAR